MKFISPEKTYTRHGVNVVFKTQDSRQDRRHLVVVFSGFCPIGKYNFDGTVADGCKFSILWINDVFDGNNSYYVCNRMDFSVEAAVISLIESEIARLGLEKSECTLLGYSKGGSAALYFGLKYSFTNVVASAPQMHIGSFSRDNFPSSYEHMIGNVDEEIARKKLDSLLPLELEHDEHYEKNIYLISSEDDQFHDTEIVPYLGLMSRYSNFNLIMTDSPLVREHKTVGQYNTPIILSILYALGEGSIPRFLVGKTGRGDYYSNKTFLRSPDDPVEWKITSDRIAISQGTFFLEGVALIKGSPQVKYSDKLITLNLSTSYDSRQIPLGSVIDKTISERFYEEGFCDYRTAAYKTRGGLGIELSDFEEGSYRLTLTVEIGEHRTVVSLPPAGRLPIVEFHNGFYYYLRASAGELILTKRSLLGGENLSGIAEFSRLELVGSRLHVEGIFAITGMSYSAYDSNLFSLILQSTERTLRFPLSQGNRPEITPRIDAGFGDYSKAYFASRNYQGIDLGNIAPDEYMIYVSTFAGAAVFTLPCKGYRLLVTRNGPSLLSLNATSA